MNNDIYKMKLHEVITQGSMTDLLEIRAVPGGWIYTTRSNNPNGLSVSSCFVPFNDEFKAVNLKQRRPELNINTPLLT